MTRKGRFISMCVAAVLGLGAVACVKPIDTKKPRPQDNRTLTAFENTVLSLAGTDALGRDIAARDGFKTDKTRYVGLFYSAWLGQHQDIQLAVYDNSKLIAAGKESVLLDPAGSAESPREQFHFWGEPLYGYYNMKDPWVVTRHVEMLTLAGIDYLCVDSTNAVVYVEAITLLLDTLQKFSKQGFVVPKVVFYTNSNSGSTVTRLYDQFYNSDKYYDCWFRPNGKPVIVGITKNNNRASDQTKYGILPANEYVKDEHLAFFDVMESEWPNGDFNEGSLPWMSWQYPQNIHNGAVNVPVAQHSHTRISMSYRDAESSRAYNNVTHKLSGQNFRAGNSFQQMWDGVFDRDGQIGNVLVTSFNEWMAIKTIYKDGNGDDAVHYVDVYDEEYSRDIEPMRGGYGDNFFMQLIANVRRYKLTEGVVYQKKTHTVDITAPDIEAQWAGVTAAYKDFAGDAVKRDFYDAVSSRERPTRKYVDASNRNDITDIRVAHSDTHLYIYVKTVDDITPYNGTDVNWMNLLIAAGGGASFDGYSYIVNRAPHGGKTSVEKSTGGYNWTTVGEADLAVAGNVLQLAVPLAALGLTADDVNIRFKLADNVTAYDDMMDYYVSGDVAPLGRIGFTY